MPSLEEHKPPGDVHTEKKIILDLGVQRRHSFLPEGWEEKRPTNFRNLGSIELQEDEDLFFFMQSQATRAYEDKPLIKLCTGSKYLGQWNKLGIAGKGVYKYPHGVIYDGYFNRNGEFHGNGILIYPNGYRMEGTWKNGKLGPNPNYISQAGVVLNKNYCLPPDRRFQIECDHDFLPVGQEYLTNEAPPARKIPDECYDLVDGFYDPNIKSVMTYPQDKRRQSKRKSDSDDRKSSIKYLFSGDGGRRSAFTQVSESSKSDQHIALLMRDRSESDKIISWIPSIEQEAWIIKNCRKAWDESVGYRPDFYEEWTKSGRFQKDHEEEQEEIRDSKYTLHTLNLDKPKRTHSRRHCVICLQRKSL